MTRCSRSAFCPAANPSKPWISGRSTRSFRRRTRHQSSRTRRQACRSPGSGRTRQPVARRRRRPVPGPRGRLTMSVRSPLPRRVGPCRCRGPRARPPVRRPVRSRRRSSRAPSHPSNTRYRLRPRTTTLPWRQPGRSTRWRRRISIGNPERSGGPMSIAGSRHHRPVRIRQRHHRHPVCSPPAVR